MKCFRGSLTAREELPEQRGRHAENVTPLLIQPTNAVVPLIAHVEQQLFPTRE